MTSALTPRARIKVSRSVPIVFSRLRDLMWRADLVEAWLGSGSAVKLRTRSSVTLPDHPLTDSSGRVSGIRASDVDGTDSRFTLELTWRQRDGRGHLHVRTVTITLTSQKARTRVTVVERGIRDGTELAAALAFWQTSLNRLGLLVSRAKTRSRAPRQALIVVHGIGEQRPGETLFDLVRALFPHEAATDRGMWPKPDTIAATFELHRVTIPAGTSPFRPTTDIYELYWAHLIRDSTFAHVRSWLLGLILRPTKELPPAFRPYRVLAIGLIVMLAIVALLFWLAGQEILPAWVAVIAAVVTGISGVALPFITSVAVNWVGDAARYLEAKPDNILRRQAIREAGVSLIEKLHESGRYDRIVVFGHSLGSVIAYDIINVAWSRMHRRHRSPTTTAAAAMRDIEAKLDANPVPDQRHELQHQAWAEHRMNTQPWLVTDFVTAGSPLAHAPFLLASRKADLDSLIGHRIIVTDPPAPEIVGQSKRISFDQSHVDPFSGRRRTMTVPHHAAPFAVTRWTNLYFPITGFLRGDPVGGPISSRIGRWVHNVPLPHPGGGFLGFAHTFYWSRRSDAHAHIDELKAALNLDCGDELLALNRRLPAHLFL